MNVLSKWMRARRREKNKQAERQRKLNRSDDERVLVELKLLVDRYGDDIEHIHFLFENTLLSIIKEAYPQTHDFIESLKPLFGYKK